ncbi:OB-fold protein [Flavobacterium sp. SM2513]|uniref:OB-fold protein n=1 Tax=Flavobacterium sp. SM2513 TaxID=3424766 RepID=UPI003D7F7957
MKKIIITSIFVLAAAAVGVYFYVYQSHRDISSEKADFSVSISTLQKEFNNNDSVFNSKYADKTIEIYGKTTTIDVTNHSIVIDDKATIIFTDTILQNITLQEDIKIKGRYVGYDDLLEEFTIDQATIVK